MPTVVDKRDNIPFDPSQERQRLQRVCLRYTGDPFAAEDLAQETILIGLRRAKGQGNAPREWSPFLFGVARRLCQTWRTTRGLEQDRFAPLDDATTTSYAQPAAIAPDPLEFLLLGEREAADRNSVVGA